MAYRKTYISMTTKFLSNGDIYEALSLSKSVIQKAIITFIFSTGVKKEILVDLTIKDFLEACGRDIQDKNALNELLTENPLEILPCWTFDKLPDKIIFNSYEATFYLFLHLKNRPPIKEYDEPLFANVKKLKVKKYQPDTIMEKITDASPNPNFKQGKLIDTFKNVCDIYITDDEVKNLFTNDFTVSNNKNQLKMKLQDDLFKDRLIDEYKRIVPYLTAGHYMYEHLKKFISFENIGDDYKVKIKKYFENNFKLRFKDFDDVCKAEILSNAYIRVKSDINKNIYEESEFYFKKLLRRAEITILFNYSKYHKKELDYNSDPIHINDNYYNACTSHERVNLIYDCIKELSIIETYNLDPKDVRNSNLNQLALSNLLGGEFHYFQFEEVVLLSIFEVLNI